MKRSRSFTIQKIKIGQKNKQFKSLDKATPQNTSRKGETVPQAIRKHIQKRADVEIIVYYEQYKQQFFLKCKKLHEYLYKFPAMRDKYVNDQNPHFKFALQFLLLDLFRRGVIVPNSYDNMRNWILSWVQRKLLYQKAKEQEKQQVIRTCQALSQLEDYVRIIEVEELPF